MDVVALKSGASITLSHAPSAFRDFEKSLLRLLFLLSVSERSFPAMGSGGSIKALL